VLASLIAEIPLDTKKALPMCSYANLLEMARNMSHLTCLVASIPKITLYAVLARPIAEISLDTKNALPMCSSANLLGMPRNMPIRLVMSPRFRKYPFMPC